MSFSIILLNVSSLVLIAILIVLSLRRLEATGAAQFVVIGVLACIWALGSFLELVAYSFEAKLFWRNVTQIGTFYLPVANLSFALAYSGTKASTRRPIVGAGYLLQTLPQALIWTDGIHHLMRSRVEVIVRPLGFSAVSVKSTVLGSSFVSLNYVLVGLALAVLVVFALKNSPFMRRQILLTALGLLVPTLFAAIKNISGDSSLEGIPSSASFVVGGCLVVGGMYSLGFLSLTPIARDRAFNVIDEGILVSDPQGRVVDANPAARAMLSRHQESRCVGQGHAEYRDLLAALPGLSLQAAQKEGGFGFSMPVLGAQALAHYRLKIFELKDRGLLSGYVGVLRDVTNETQQADLLRIRAERDCLTGIYNRAAFIELVSDCARRHADGGYLLIFDIDGFKAFNDSYGHLAGDAVLKGICETCKATLRDEDIFGRVGGDEFAIFLKGLEEANARKLADRLRARVEETSILFEGRPIAATISVGLAPQVPACDEDGGKLAFEALFSRADAALYQSKSLGRNRVTVA